MFDVRGFFVKMLCYKQGKSLGVLVNTLRPGQNGHLFADAILHAFSWTKMYEFRLKLHCTLIVPNGPLDNI